RLVRMTVRSPTILSFRSLHDALPISKGLLQERAPHQPMQLGLVLQRSVRYVANVPGIPVGRLIVLGPPGIQVGVELFFLQGAAQDRKSTRLNSSHVKISYAVFCLKKK